MLAGVTAMLAGACILGIGASSPAAAQDACARIRAVCQAAGFREGEVNIGRGIDKDCIDPILHHQRPPARAALPLPRIDPHLVAACLHPGIVASAPPIRPPPAATPVKRKPGTTPPAPASGAATATSAALPPATTNSAVPTATPANSAPSNSAPAESAANAGAAPTNAAPTPTAASPSPGAVPWPLILIAALAVLAAGAGAAILLAMRRRSPPGPRPVAGAPASAPVATAKAPAVPPASPGLEAAATAAVVLPAAAVAAAAAAEPPPAKTHDVFISYSSKDKPTADAICAVMEQQGIRCWIAPRDILPGQQWAGAILRAIAGARVVVLVFSASSNTSPQVLREIERAVHNGAAIIPFRIEDIPFNENLEYFVSSPHWLDAITPPLEGHAKRLAESVRSLLSQSPAS